MRQFAIFGDTHGDYGHYMKNVRFLDRLGIKDSIQLGDHGILAGTLPPIIENNRHMFFCGNHDNYKAVEGHKNYMGRYGSVMNDQVLFISGGYSPDVESRTAGFDYFYYEQLDEYEMEKAWQLALAIKPVMLITHEPPDLLVDDLIANNPFKHNFPRRASKTGIFLNKFVQYPGLASIKNWYFGHWHYEYEISVSGIQFKCIPNNEVWITHV